MNGSVNDHKRLASRVDLLKWILPINRISYPIIVDSDFKVTKMFDMVHDYFVPTKDCTKTKEESEMMQYFFVINKDKKIKLLINYPIDNPERFKNVVEILKSSMSNL